MPCPCGLLSMGCVGTRFSNFAPWADSIRFSVGGRWSCRIGIASWKLGIWGGPESLRAERTGFVVKACSKLRWPVKLQITGLRPRRLKQLLSRLQQFVLKHAMQCAEHLTSVLRVRPQRQKWVSLLVRALQSEESFQAQFQEALFSDRKLLCAEAEQQLKAFSQHASRYSR